MNRQDFDNIKIEYKAFLENISFSYSYIEELVDFTNKFLSEYCKSKHCDKKFAKELEINLLYLEKFHQNIDNIIEIIESVTLDKLTLPEIKNVFCLEDFISIPDDYDNDILVDLNDSLNLDK